MATIALTVTDVQAVAGRIYVRWSDGIESEFPSLQAAKDYARSLAEEKETLKKLGLSRYFFLDPTGSNPALIEGKTITFTNESNTLVSVA